MNLVAVLQTGFLVSAGALAVFSVVPLISRHQLELARRNAASLLTCFAMVLLARRGLEALVAFLSPHPLARIGFLAFTRGQYAWIYWCEIFAILLPQIFWVPALRRKPLLGVIVGLACLFLVCSRSLAVLIWGSH
jgi:hypothetical protein